MKKILICGIVAMAIASCSTGVTVTKMERTRMVIDSRYDGRETAEVKEFMAPYTAVVDSIMKPVVGRIEVNAEAYRPESPLSNLLADILVWAGKDYSEKPDLGMYNMGGIRASLTKGDVTYGDILEVAPFDNKICFLTLTGADLLELFQQFASRGGEGVSRSVRLWATADRELKRVTINGKDIDPKANYRIATIDYLAAGNDKLTVFQKKTDYNAPSGSENDCKEVICRYFRAMKKEGTKVIPKVEGRITLINN